MDKKLALSQLRQSRFVYERGLVRQDAERRTKLHRFLDQHKHASQWSASVAALEDAVRHGVSPNDAAVCRAMQQCGQAGQLKAAKRLYTDLYRRIGRPRPLAAHVAFMSACADAGDFDEAHRQLCALRSRDVALHAKSASHKPVVNDDVTTEYLRAALCASLVRGGENSGGASRGDSASVRIPVGEAAVGASAASAAGERFTPKESDRGPAEEHTTGADGGGRRSDASRRDSAWSGDHTVASAAPWQVALESFLALRKDTQVFRPSNELTPLLLEHATQLACVGRQWKLCLAILRGAEAEQALIPPEAYDAAIRACFQAQRHSDVVQLMEQLMATRVAPDERSVRLALISSEEISAVERQSQPIASSPSPNSSSSPAVGGSSGGWSMALTLFHALERNGLPLYQQSYEAPLRACANAGKWKEAFQMLDAMRRDRRPVSPPVYAQALAARVEATTSWTELRRLLRVSALTDEASTSVVLYLAALRACMRQGDWKHFAELNREMRDRDIPETFDKMRLLIEAAYLQEKYHSVLMRFARFENITQYERRRVVKDQLVRLYTEDFELPPPLLEMVLDSYAKVKDYKDPMVEAAYQAALRHKERLSGAQSLPGDHTAPEEWMFSQAARETRTPPQFH
ncbi:hypothetical protein ABB37_01727 [Leptomonas pyrrhocoris]|uniref:Pentacotripeptide-repeat region of PRORP domain-containing protein n=1 Tax=Leptomonas pyrrhocoris TaxID=157538 RepID=A0A0M9G9K4_LEPPY|nr:hypothetical protein ABB37_01727 [Leptomonas pyrrhocoris]KPA85419.1 hypothetical protein ABB37_01727 [Leptomonas pyrrhocoris]|eukprot:XP_015663858.1 hypothetical protein ABB37_01727 [Leptomonas pyrrhocoris]